MKKIICLFVVVLLTGGHALSIAAENGKFNPVGQTYYTSVNIWYVRSKTKETVNKIEHNNKHLGGVLPAGAKVVIKLYEGNTIDFSDELSVSYRLLHSRTKPVNLAAFFNRYFSKENPIADGGVFSKLTQQEQKNIESRVIDYEMSKEAVLMAYGYPQPLEGFVPDIKSDCWQYLNKSNDKINVYFKDNKVGRIEDIKARVKRFIRRPPPKVSVREPGVNTNAPGQLISAADEIAKYKKLLDNGVITKVEFEQKKKQLLGL